MDWRDLATFLAAARAGSLGGAARALRVDQTTVGRRLQSLEEAVGTRLFDRTPEGLRLTVAGRAALPSVERMAESAEELRRLIASTDGELSGRVTVTTSDAFSTQIARYLAPLHERFPDIEMHLTISDKALDLARREADIAVRFRPTEQADLTLKRAGSIEWGVFASPACLERRSRPASEHAIEGHDVVGFSEAMAETPGGLYLQRQMGSVRVVQVASTLLAIHAATCAGIGIGAFPLFLAGFGPPLERIGGPIGERPIHLVAHPDVLRSVRVRRVFDFLANELARDFPPCIASRTRA